MVAVVAVGIGAGLGLVLAALAAHAVQLGYGQGPGFGFGVPLVVLAYQRHRWAEVALTITLALIGARRAAPDFESTGIAARAAMEVDEAFPVLLGCAVTVLTLVVPPASLLSALVSEAGLSLRSVVSALVDPASSTSASSADEAAIAACLGLVTFLAATAAGDRAVVVAVCSVLAGIALVASGLVTPAGCGLETAVLIAVVLTCLHLVAGGGASGEDLTEFYEPTDSDDEDDDDGGENYTKSLGH